MGAKSKEPSTKQNATPSRHPLCVGFDPDTSDLHPFLQKQFTSTPLESFLVRRYESTISKITKSAHSIKLQSAFFEQFGPAGMIALRDITIDVKRRGLYLILDAKRGDISSTMAAYGRMAFDQMQADALTILPWMGTDSLTALLPWLKEGKRVYIVWLSSNKSGRELQMVETSKKGRPIALTVFDQFLKAAKKNNVEKQIGWVLGATDIPKEILKKLPKGPQHFLLPGIGAQGANFGAHTKSLLKQHPESLFPISRGILKPTPQDRIENWEDYSLAVATKWQSFIQQWEESEVSSQK